MKLYSRRILCLIVFMLVLCPTVLNAQFGGFGDIGRAIKKAPGIDNLIAGIPGLGGGQYEEAITTNFTDAVTEVPFLDDYQPIDYKHLERSPGRQGRFVWAPGRWTAEIESYCLHAGTHGPSEGKGYLYAPLKGPLGEVINNILSNCSRHPEIPQYSIQTLIWGIEARTKISDMGAGTQKAAAAFLTPDEIRDLNGGSLGIIPTENWNKVFAHTGLPPAVQQAIETEARIRGMLTSGATYGELERVAVLDGVPTEPDARNIPRERWSFNPRGYFVRYVPSGYSWTHMCVSVPDIFQTDFDAQGRLTAIRDSRGNRFEATYDDTVTPISIQGAAGPIGFAFSKLKFIRTDPATGAVLDTKEWNKAGWTLIGAPASGARIAGTPSGSFTNINNELTWAREHYGQVAQLYHTLPSSDLRANFAYNAIQIGLFTHAVQQLLNTSECNTGTPIGLLKESWQFYMSLCMRATDGQSGSDAETAGSLTKIDTIAKHKAGRVDVSHTPPTRRTDPDWNGCDFDSAGDIACPANPTSQRLGQSDRQVSNTDQGNNQNNNGSGEDAGRQAAFEAGRERGKFCGNDQAQRDSRDWGSPSGKEQWQNSCPDYPLAPDSMNDPNSDYNDQWNSNDYRDGWEDGWPDGYQDGLDSVQQARDRTRAAREAQENSGQPPLDGGDSDDDY
jgi:hypothetical protein